MAEASRGSLQLLNESAESTILLTIVGVLGAVARDFSCSTNDDDGVVVVEKTKKKETETKLQK